MPGGTVGDERIPPFGTPTLGDASSLEDEMRYAALTQMLAHRHPRLAAADDKGIYLFNRHFLPPFPTIEKRGNATEV
jgi:hypothetical protein